MSNPKKRLTILLLRAITLASIFACIGVSAYKKSKLNSNTLDIKPSELTQWFPNANALANPAGDLQATPVLDTNQTILGYILQTSPASNKIIGYAGPTNTLIALTPEYKIIGFRIRNTADTSSHIAKIDPTFWNQFTKKSPATLPPNPTTTSGATLTTEAIAKSIRARLTNTAAEPWFQSKVTLTQAQKHFPTTTTLKPIGKTRQAFDSSNKLLGHLILSTDCPDQTRGFQGPTALLIALSPDQKTLLGITLLASRDNPSYLENVQEELKYTDQFSNKPIDQILADKTPATNAFFVSGASYTATATIAQLRQTLHWLRAPTTPEPPTIHWQLRDTLLTIWLLIALTIGITHLRGNKKTRLTLQLICILLGGIYLGTFVSQGLLIGWTQNGIPWRTYPALVLLTASAFLIPLSTGKNTYCQQICPHGALQNTLFDLTKKKLAIPPTLHKTLSTLPWILLITILTLALLHTTSDYSIFETFDAWSTGIILSIPVILLIATTLTAPYIRTPYCHYACPTGALIKLTAGPKHRILKRDIIAATLSAAAWLITLI